MNQLVKIALLVDNDSSRLVSRTREVLEVLSDAGASFRVDLVAGACSDYALEAAHELALQYPQVQVVEPGKQAPWKPADGEAERPSAPSSADEFDLHRIRRLVAGVNHAGRVPTGGDGSEHSKASPSAAPGPAKGSKDGLRLAVLQRRRQQSETAVQRIDSPQTSDKVPLPFSLRARSARGSGERSPSPS
jgi:hypothetical protein